MFSSSFFKQEACWIENVVIRLGICCVTLHIKEDEPTDTCDEFSEDLEGKHNYHVLQYFFASSFITTSGQIFLEDRDLGFLNINLSNPISYKIQGLVNQLNLQFCTIVEVGEGFCSLFVEFRSNLKSNVVYPDNVAEVFLGLCQCSALRSWQYCSKQLQEVRPQDCMFQEATENSSARVHRRLCDVTGMQRWNPECNCSHEFAGQHLYPVTGFRTCFRSPLPESICSPRSVCGVAQCSTKTLFQVHMVQCDPNCRGRQPFCEDKEPKTTNYCTVHSLWSPWSKTVCNQTSKFLESESMCINSDTKSPAFDCLGPGIYCCPATFPECKCEVLVTNVMKVKRTLRPCDSPYVPEQVFEQKLDVGVIDQPILSDIESDEVRSSKLLNINIFDKAMQRARRIVDVKNYSSQWESPTECILSSVPKSDRIGGLSFHKQHNWDVLEPKNSDPWHEMRQLGIQDQNVMFHKNLNAFKNIFNTSAVSPVDPLNPDVPSKNSEIGKVENNFEVLFKDNNASTYVEKSTGLFNKDKVQPMLRGRGHSKDKNNSFVPINVNSVFKSYFGRKNSKSLFSQKKNDSTNNIYEPEFGFPDPSNVSHNRVHIFKKISDNAYHQNDKGLENTNNNTMNARFNLNRYPGNVYQSNANLIQMDNNRSTFENCSINHFQQIHSNSGQIHNLSTFAASNPNEYSHNLQPIYSNSDQIHNESIFDGSNLNEYQNNFQRVLSNSNQIKNTSMFEGYNLKESPNSFHLSHPSNLNSGTNNSLLDKDNYHPKLLPSNVYRIHSNPDPMQLNNSINRDSDKFKNSNDYLAYGHQILGKSDQMNNDSMNGGYYKHESYFNNTKKAANEVYRTHFDSEQNNMNNNSTQNQYNRFLNYFYHQPSYITGQMNTTYKTKEYNLNNPFLSDKKNNYSSSYYTDFDWKIGSGNLNNNASINKLRDLNIAELNNKKRYLTIDVIRKHIFNFVANFTNQTACNKNNFNCEFKNNLALVYASMPFLREIIINSLHEMPSMKYSMSNISGILVHNNCTSSFHIPVNMSDTTPLSTDIQVIEIDTNNLNEVYKNIKSPSSGNCYINEPGGRSSNSSSNNGKNIITARINKNNSYLNESHAFILPIHLGTINFNPGSNNTVRCKKKNK